MALALRHINRHPIKAHGYEPLAEAQLAAGACLPWDRHWAVAHAGSQFDPAAREWVRCANFQRGARTPTLMAITARLDEAEGLLRLTHPDRPPLAFHPDRAEEAAAFLAWLAPLSPEGPFRPTALVSAPGRGMTDSAFPSVSLGNLASHAAIEGRLGQPLSRHRWRANLWLEGLEPFAELDLVGREVRLGAALLRVEAVITRCKATTANPETGAADADTLGALRALTGGQQFAVYARVLQGGRVTLGDRAEVA